MADRIITRHDTAENWIKYNPILLNGEQGYVTENPNQYKMGDGVRKWNDLPFRGYDGTLVHELGSDSSSVMSQRAVTDAISSIRDTFQPDATTRRALARLVKAIYLRDEIIDATPYYSIARIVKTETGLLLDIVKSSQKGFFSDWSYVAKVAIILTWGQDIVVKYESDNLVLYIDASFKGEMDESGMNYDRAGLSLGCLNNGNGDYLNQIANELIPIENSWTNGEYIDLSGVVRSYGALKRSSFIVVDPAKVYAIDGIVPILTECNAVSFYCADFKFISGIHYSTKVICHKRLSPPLTAAYMMLSSDKSTSNSYVIRTTSRGVRLDVSVKDAVVTYAPALPRFIDVVQGEFSVLNITSAEFNRDALYRYFALPNYPLVLFSAGKLIVNQTEENITTVSLLCKIGAAILKTIKLRSVSSVSPVPHKKNICIAGDSLIDNEYCSRELYNLLSSDTNLTVSQIGIRGAAAKHEGRGSWSWATYIDPLYESTEFSGKTNAFMRHGILDFKSYMTTNFPHNDIDYFFMCLGTNDVLQGTTILSESSLDEIVSNATTFIDAFFDPIRGYPDAKFIIGLCASGATESPYTNSSEKIFREAIQLLNYKMITKFDEGKYNPNLTCVAHGLFIDPARGYPSVELATDRYTPLYKQKAYTNLVHPNELGYKQLGFGIYSKIRALVSGNL